MSTSASAALETAAALHRAGHLAEAREVLSQFVRAHGGDAEGHFRLALVLADLSELAAAERSARTALGLSPRGAYAFLLGDLLERQDKTAEARDALRQSVALDPRLAAAHARMAELSQREGNLAEAEQSYRIALALRPNDVRVLNNLSALLLATRQPRAAEDFARRALAQSPEHAQAHFNLARAVLSQGRPAEALDVVERLRTLHPNNIEARELQGAVLEQTGMLAAAVPVLESVGAWERVAHLRMQQGFVPESIEASRRAAEQHPERAAAIESAILFASQFDGASDTQEIFAQHCAWAERHAPGGPIPAFPNDRDPGRVLRVGYLSSRFVRSSAAFLFEPVVQFHDHSAVQVFCYANHDDEDDVTARLRARSTWRKVNGLDDAALVQAIRDDRIDILVDLSGHTPGHRLTALAAKPAPLVMTWLDYFNTTGLASVDYLVSDASHSPLGDLQPFVEEILRLPQSRFCYSPPSYAPPVEPPRARAAGEVVFGSFARMAKVSTATLSAWGAVMQRIPKARLVVKNSALGHEGEHEAHRDRFAQVAGIDPARIEFRGPSKHDEMLRQYGDIDVVLDTVPYNGGLTTLEALWMGRPVVAMRGSTLIGRQSASLLGALGLHELVASDVAGFASIAQAIALDHDKRTTLATQLRGRLLASPIGRCEDFTRDLENLYRRAWQGWSEAWR